MDEAAIKPEMRLCVLKKLVCDLLVMNLSLMPYPKELLEKIRSEMIEGSRRRTLPGFDAVQSDLLSAELEAAVDRLLGMAKEQMQIGLESGPRAALQQIEREIAQSLRTAKPQPREASKAKSPSK